MQRYGQKHQKYPQNGVLPICDPARFFTFVPLWCFNFMQKIRKYQTVSWDIYGRTNRQGRLLRTPSGKPRVQNVSQEMMKSEKICISENWPYQQFLVFWGISMYLFKKGTLEHKKWGWTIIRSYNFLPILSNFAEFSTIVTSLWLLFTKTCFLENSCAMWLMISLYKMDMFWWFHGWKCPVNSCS